MKRDSIFEISDEFLLCPEAEPIRRVAESLYPKYLQKLAKNGEELNPCAIPVLDKKFMLSSDGRWARILAETSYAEHVIHDHSIHDTVVFFGSARLGVDESKRTAKRASDTDFNYVYEECRELARRVTLFSLEQGTEKHPQPYVITTGGGPAIMEAGNRGAKDAGGITIGLNITLPMEQHPNPYITPELNFDFHYFFTRKFHFSYRAKVLVAFPGGFGTFDELFEILTLIQTGKIVKSCLILLYGKEFWNKVINFDYLVETGVIGAEDLKLFQIVDGVDEACTLIKDHLKNHSHHHHPRKPK